MTLYQHLIVSKFSRLLLFIAIGYMLLPLDIIPDFVPILGQLDDLVIVGLLVWIALKFIPLNIINDNRKTDELKSIK